MANLSINGTLKSTGGGSTLYDAELVAESGTNYIRLNSGLQICWGTLSTSGSADVEKTFSFPKPFSATPIVMRTNQGATNGNTVIRNSSTYNISVNGCTVFIYHQDPNVQLLAVGKWK